LIRNLGLIDTNDTNTDVKEVNAIIKRVVDRTYQHNGHGGLFPLRLATSDQRKVEIWYQLSAYLSETE
jgi:hypothetical protein